MLCFRVLTGFTSKLSLKASTQPDFGLSARPRVPAGSNLAASRIHPLEHPPPVLPPPASRPGSLRNPLAEAKCTGSVARNGSSAGLVPGASITCKPGQASHGWPAAKGGGRGCASKGQKKFKKKLPKLPKSSNWIPQPQKRPSEGAMVTTIGVSFTLHNPQKSCFLRSLRTQCPPPANGVNAS